LSGAARIAMRFMGDALLRQRPGGITDLNSGDVLRVAKT
jgi:hypothetical protein